MARQERANKVGAHRQAFDRNRNRILKTQEFCGICGKPVDTSIKDPLDPMAPVIDHIIPIAKGGHPSDISNLQLAHRWCNRQKSDKLIDIQARFRDQNKADEDTSALPNHFEWNNYKA